MVSGLYQTWGWLHHRRYERDQPAEVWIAFAGKGFQPSIENGATNLQEQVGTFARPSHRLLLAHSLIDQVGDSSRKGNLRTLRREKANLATGRAQGVLKRLA
jgi:hypothetical protein